MSDLQERKNFVAGAGERKPRLYRMGERAENERQTEERPELEESISMPKQPKIPFKKPMERDLEDYEKETNDCEIPEREKEDYKTPKREEDCCDMPKHDEDCCDDCDKRPKREVAKLPGQKCCVRKAGRMIFRQGCEGQFDENEKLEVSRLQLRPKMRQNQAQSPAELSRDLYNKMLILEELYQDLKRFPSSNTAQLQDMIEELRVVTFAMGRIYQTIARTNRLPRQNQQKPRIRNYCTGLVTTSDYLREILSDLRRLQRVIDNSNIDVQLVIINLTLMSQQQQLQQMRLECRAGRDQF